MEILQNIAAVVLLLGVMILFHEMGHFLAALFFDVHVEAFSFGFGPRILGFRRGETDFRVSLIPFGGYVKMLGEQIGDETTVVSDPRSFLAKPRWQRMIIAFAGPFMNVVLSIGLLTGLFMYKYPKVEGADEPFVVGWNVPNSVAEQAGIQEGDKILKFDDVANPTFKQLQMLELNAINRPVAVAIERQGKPIYLTLTPKMDEKKPAPPVGWLPKYQLLVQGVRPEMDAARVLKPKDIMLEIDGKPVYAVQRLHYILKEGAGKPVELTFSRDGQIHKEMITPQISTLEEGTKQYLLGVNLTPRYVFVQLPFTEAVLESLHDNWNSAGYIFNSLKGIVERRLSPKQLSGPIGLAREAGVASREGAAYYIGFMSMVSMNLAILNLMPIPILDGGLILTLLIEMLMRRDLSLQFKENVFKLGFVFLMTLMAFVIYNDISRYAG